MIDRVINESSKRITCGYQGYKGHNGVDLGWRSDEVQNNVYVNSKGIVIDVRDGLDTLPLSSSSWGNYVLVDHPNGMRSRYAHLRKGSVRVSKGQVVDENTVLGIIGESGSVKGRHLHFEVYKDGVRINPTEYLTKPIYEEIKTSEPVIKNNEFNIGDKVLVLNGYATADSYGGGTHTATYDGNKHPEDISNYLIISDIISSPMIGQTRIIHLRRTDERGSTHMGWVTKEQIKKV